MFSVHWNISHNVDEKTQCHRKVSNQNNDIRIEAIRATPPRKAIISQLIGQQEIIAFVNGNCMNVSSSYKSKSTPSQFLGQ